MSNYKTIFAGNKAQRLWSTSIRYAERGHLADCVVSTEESGGGYKAHKLVLSAASPYFASCFAATGSQPDTVMIGGMTNRTLEQLLLYLYRGEVEIEGEDIADFRAGCTRLQILERLNIEEVGETTINDVTINLQPKVRLERIDPDIKTEDPELDISAYVSEEEEAETRPLRTTRRRSGKRR